MRFGGRRLTLYFPLGLLGVIALAAMLAAGGEDAPLRRLGDTLRRSVRGTARPIRPSGADVSAGRAEKPKRTAPGAGSGRRGDVKLAGQGGGGAGTAGGGTAEAATSAPATRPADSATSGPTSGPASQPSTLPAASRPTSGTLAKDAATTAPQRNTEPTTATLQVRVVWEKDMSPIAGATVAHIGHGADYYRIFASATTDAAGLATLEVFASGYSARVEVKGAGVIMQRIRVPLRNAGPYTIHVERGYTAFGKVLQGSDAEGWKPAAGAEVWPLCKKPPMTKSGPDGAYELEGIPEQRVRLAARLGNLRSSTAADEQPVVELKMGERNGPFDLRLRSGLTLTGVVVEREGGAPIPGAEVRLLDENSRDNLYEILQTDNDRIIPTDDEGTFSFDGLSRGRQQLRVVAPEHGDAVVNVQMEEGKENYVVVELGPGGVIQCLVVDQEEMPVAGASINIRRAGGWYVSRPPTNEQGRATVDGVREGVEYNMWAWYGKTGSSGAHVTLAAGEREREVKFTFPFKLSDEESGGPRGVIEGYVGDPMGLPIIGAHVTAQQGWAVARNVAQDRAVTGPDGRYRMELQRSAFGGLYLSAAAQGWAPAWITDIRPGAAETPAQVNFTLQPGHGVEVTAVDEADRPLQGVSVKPFPATRDIFGEFGLPGQPVYQTGRDGVARIDSLPEQTLLSLWKSGRTRLERQAVQVDGPARFVLRPAGVIRGRVLAASSRAPVTDFRIVVAGPDVDRYRSESGQQFTSADGGFELQDLAPGKMYDLTVMAPPYAPYPLAGVAAQLAETAGALEILLIPAQ